MTTQGLMGKGVPAGMPPFLLYIKIAIMVLSLIILALAAYTIAIWNQWTSGIGYGYYVYSGVGGLLIFVVIKTWIIYGVFLALEFKAPHMYYRIAAIIAYVLSIIFWLSAWAWSASNASLWLGVYSGYDYGVVYDNNPFKGYGAALAACAGLGAVVWVLSIVHLVFFARACMNDNSTVTHSQAELGQVSHQKHEATTNVYAAPAPGAVYAAPAPAGYQQAYPQQQYAQPQQTYATQ